MNDRPDPSAFAGQAAFDLPQAPLAMPVQALRGPGARAGLGRAPRAPLPVLALRALAILGSLGAGLAALWLFVWIGGADGAGFSTLEILRAALGFAATWWLAWGAALALIGLAVRRAPPVARAEGPLTARVALVTPVCNEDPVQTFARIAATARSVAEARAAQGAGGQFDIVILSDTRDAAVAAAEVACLPRLADQVQGLGRLHYRRRTDNAGRKAGNIAEFLRRSGAAWDFALILDADSLMDGRTVLELTRRMQADPGLGLIQTLPQVIRARSWFGRAAQFGAALHGPVFARGLAALQGAAGPFWGHNAMVRIAAFAGSCGLPHLPGRPPFGGAILSHDTVEAAFLVRGGWRVRLDADLRGSFEEAPDTLIDHARRDRRWCQGNLQHAGLLTATGLSGWSRFSLAQGIMAYLAPPLWLVFLVVTVLGAVTAQEPVAVFDELGRTTLFPVATTGTAILLGLGVLALLFLPKLLIALDAILTGRARDFGGAGAVLRGMGAELVLASVIAPIQMMFQSRAVAQVLLGRDGGWPPQDRRGGRVSLAEALGATRAFVWVGAGALAATAIWAPDLVVWLLPVALPLIAAPGLIVALSVADTGALFRVPQNGATAPVMGALSRLLRAWEGDDPALRPAAAPADPAPPPLAALPRAA